MQPEILLGLGAVAVGPQLRLVLVVDLEQVDIVHQSDNGGQVSLVGSVKGEVARAQSGDLLDPGLFGGGKFKAVNRHPAADKFGVGQIERSSEILDIHVSTGLGGHRDVELFAAHRNGYARLVVLVGHPLEQLRVGAGFGQELHTVAGDRRRHGHVGAGADSGQALLGQFEFGQDLAVPLVAVVQAVHEILHERVQSAKGIERRAESLAGDADGVDHIGVGDVPFYIHVGHIRGKGIVGLSGAAGALTLDARGSAEHFLHAVPDIQHALKGGAQAVFVHIVHESGAHELIEHRGKPAVGKGSLGKHCVAVGVQGLYVIGHYFNAHAHVAADSGQGRSVQGIVTHYVRDIRHF